MTRYNILAPFRVSLVGRLNSFLLIDTTTMVHLPGLRNRGECHLHFAEGVSFLYGSYTAWSRIICLMESRIQT